MNRRRPVLVLLALVLLVAGCASSSKPKAQSSGLNGQNQVGPYLGAGFNPPRPRPSFTLTDTAGKPFEFGTVTAKHPTFLYFGYTNCPDVCPETMADIGLALSKVPKAIAAKTYVVFVTTDVKRDTGAVIHEWLSNFPGENLGTWVGLRGTQTQIDAAQAAAHVLLAEDSGETHSAEAILYGPDNYAHVEFLQSDNEQQQIAHDLPIVAKG